MNEQVKIVSLGVIALSLVVQTVIDIAELGGESSPAPQQQQTMQKQANANQPDKNQSKSPQQQLQNKLQQKQVKKQQQKPDRPTTSVSFDKKSHDFGTIGQNTKVKETFEFTNTGKNPLVINNAKGSCGCTVPKYPKKPIPPGEKGEIVVAFSSGKKKGKQRNSVTINANTDPSPLRLNIQANVKPGA